MAIDDRIAKIQEIIGPTDEDAPMQSFTLVDLGGGLMTVGAIFSPLIAVYSAAKNVLDMRERNQRVKAALRAICDELYSIRESLPANAEEALKGKWFRRAAAIVIEEAARAEDEDRAVLLALVAVHGCFPQDENKHCQEDLANYIRDLAELGLDDIQMLKLLEETYKEATRVAPNLNMNDMFAPHYEEFKLAATRLGIHTNDWIALGSRLTGYGLAFETQRNNMRQSPTDTFFRPTRRGLYLLSLLRQAEERMIVRANPSA
ncbi:hypothetical protein [Tunturiibacter psychrotolerans]|uniref:hypothetical protein n=1 Tax=Tunturiibacter psychrotolerans TaxID=3069686 RepID=UPI003D1CE3EC